MKESSQKLMSSTDTSGNFSKDSPAFGKIEAPGAEFGSFVALKRLSKLNVEAVRMQGCVNGGGGGGSGGGTRN